MSHDPSLRPSALQAPIWRKTKNGWVVVGPTAIVYEGVTLEVFKADGSTSTATIKSTGRPFNVSGVRCCYGYPT